MLSSVITGLLSLLLSLSNASPIEKRAGAVAPGACSGECVGYMHDPMVKCDSHGTYYRFTTNQKIIMATAPTIAGPWTNIGAALPKGSMIDKPGNQDIWAPDIIEHNGLYYMYYCVSVLGSQNSDIGVAASKTLNGPWTDHGSIGLPDQPNYNRLDPNLFKIPSSALLLTFGSFWDGIFQTRMNDPPLTIASNKPTTLINIERNTTARAGNLPNGATEGGYQFWWPNSGGDYYYLFFSSGNCCNDPNDLAPAGEEYRTMVCRAISPTGPWTDKAGRDCLTEDGGELVLASSRAVDVYAPGGQGVMWDAAQQSVVIYYHYAKYSVGLAYEQYWFGWNKLRFENGWPVVVA